MEPTATVIAYSYVRFSSPDQAEGNSLQRQSEKAVAYCRRKGWTLDESLSLRDLGVSAFRGANALVGNLGVFLAAVKRGTVKPGSALICESIDRISRQGIDEGYDIIKGILKAGVLLVTLSPEREFDTSATKSLTKGALEIQLILERAAEESERKSERVGAAWREKQRRARAGEAQGATNRMGDGRKFLTRRLPAWVEVKGGELVLIPRRAAVVKRIFELAAAGYGYHAIVGRLKADQVPPFGERVVRPGKRRSVYSGEWREPFVRSVLNDRRALGEYQPCRGGKPDGAPIRGYFPAVVTEAEYGLALRGNGRRGKTPTRQVKHVNLFSGLLNNARGGTYIAATRLTRRGKERPQIRVLLPQGDGQHSHTFPLPAFEEAVLRHLREIKPHEILDGDHGPDEAEELSGRLAAVEDELAKVQASLNRKGYSETLDDRARKLEDDQRALTAELAEAQLRAAHPLSESWDEAHGLIDALANAPDPADARLRLRTRLREIVSGIVLLVVPRGLTRLAAVQVHFRQGGHRDYLIFQQPPRSNGKKRVEGGSWSRSLPPELAAGIDLDLRKPDAAGKLAAALAAVPTNALLSLMADDGKA